MNLAHVEYYFAKFLSAMEVRATDGTAERRETRKASVSTALACDGMNRMKKARRVTQATQPLMNRRAMSIPIGCQLHR